MPLPYKNNMTISATKHHLYFLMKSLKATQQTNGAPSHRCKPEDDLLQSCDAGEVTAVQLSQLCRRKSNIFFVVLELLLKTWRAFRTRIPATVRT